MLNNFSGRHFNPDVLQAFIGMIGVYPVGTMVRISTNEIGIVTKHNPDNAESPVVKVFFDAGGSALPSPLEVDLSSGGDKTIISTVNPSTTSIDLGAFFEKEAEAAV